MAMKPRTRSTVEALVFLVLLFSIFGALGYKMGSGNMLKTLMNTAHDWAQKAFDIEPDHLQNAKMLKQLKLQLAKEVPAELNAVIEKYTKPQE